jgi:putative ABC transport system permease protein
MEALLQDVRYGWRMLAKSPGFTAVAVITLALGIGANTAIFSVVNAVLLRPLQFSEPGRLMTIWQKAQDDPYSNVGYATFLDWQSQNHSFEHMAVSSQWTPVLGGTQQAERLQGRRVTREFFSVLLTQPLYGRDFLPGEDRPDTKQVVILSNGLWQRKFGGDPGVVGKQIPVNGIPYTVVGILPANFENIFVSDGEAAQIWAPLGYDLSQAWTCRTCQHLQAIGRLKTGVTELQALAEMDAISRNLMRDHPKEYSVAGVVLIPLQEQVVGKTGVALYTLLGAVLLVLLIACANVASLLLSRATQRGREMAVRSALGASRIRLIRQLLTEGVLLCLMGGALGLMLGLWGLRLLPLLGSANVPRIDAVSLDLRVLAFTFGLAMLSGILFGLAPAWQSARPDLNEALKEGGRVSVGGPRQRLRGAFVVSTVALALVLLLAAGLLLRSLGRLLNVDAGFTPQHLLTATLDVAGPKYQDDPPVMEFYSQVLDRVRAIPGVQNTALVSQLPLGGNVDEYGVHVEGKISPNPENDPSGDRYSISPDYLRTMGIPILRGRAFTEQDRKDSPLVVLVNDTLVRRMWPGEDPIGKRLRIGDPVGPWRTVVGVTGDVLQSSLDSPHALQFYLPETQWFVDNSRVLVVRTSGVPENLASAVRQAAAGVDSNAALSKIADMEQVVSASVGQRRFTLLLLSLFAAVALLLAAVGIYGVVSYFVSMRSQEIGIRMALGARPQDVLKLVLRHGLTLALSGAVAGLLIGMVSARALMSLLFQVRPADPLTLIAVSMLLVLTAALASYIPARRATKVDPMVALRYE